MRAHHHGSQTMTKQLSPAPIRPVTRATRRHDADDGGTAAAGGLDVLIISSYYWPETAGNAPYVTGVAEHLARRGHRVRVATGFPHYPEWKASPRGVLGTRERHEGVEIRRRRHYVPKAQSAFTRAAYEASLCTLGATALPRTAPDVIFGVSPTLTGAVLASAASRIYRRAYGVVFQDLQGRGALQSGIEGGRRIATFVEHAEVRLARRAAAVGVIAEGFGRYFEEHGVPSDRIHRLRNWSQDAIATETIAAARARLGWPASSFVCLHAGNMGQKQGLENVLHAASRIDDPEIQIVLAGAGNDRARLEALARQLRLSNLKFLPPQPTGIYEAMLRAADVLLVNQRSTVGDMSLASKLTSYFMAARPVIGAVAPSSETAHELTSARAGLLTAPDDPAALADAICWMKVHPDEASALGRRGHSYADEHLAPESVLADYDEFVRVIHDATRRSEKVVRAGRPWLVTDPRPTLMDPRPPAGVGTIPATVSCLIVSYECRRALETCLESLDRERAQIAMEVVVVDNASRDGTVAMVLDRFPWVRLVANDANVGFAHAANQGMELAEAETLLFLNPDTMVPEGAIAAAVAELDRHDDVGMLGCKLIRPDGEFDHACKRGFPTIASSLYYFLALHRLRPSSPRFAQYTAGQLDADRPGYVDAVNGAFMLAKRSAVQEVGPMDERYWLYAEDLDWCHRFWERGWKILYWPEVEVVHAKGGSTGKQRPWTLNRAFHRSMWIFYAKHHASHKPRAISALVWSGIWARFLVSAGLSWYRRRNERSLQQNPVPAMRPPG
jgi:colanic acid biosynthesis glycosyl transferase WcaI